MVFNMCPISLDGCDQGTVVEYLDEAFLSEAADSQVGGEV
jgi:hypothetical protein